MKLLKGIILTLTVMLSTAAFSQSGWNAGNYYAYKGGTSTICGNTFTVKKGYGYNTWNEGWKNCRRRNWYKEYRSGYVNYWGPNGWTSQWKEGYFWYFTWYDFQTRVW